MSLFTNVPLDRLSPARLWRAMPADTRRLAARCLYGPDCDDTGGRMEGDAAIAAAIRFRPTVVQRMPADKRADYLARVAQPTESLASSLLRALHLSDRSGMLETFLDRLGIAQENGVIEDEDDLSPPSAETLRSAVEVLRESYPAADVELYLASLLAMDPDFWGGLGSVVGAAD